MGLMLLPYLFDVFGEGRVWPLYRMLDFLKRLFYKLICFDVQSAFARVGAWVIARARECVIVWVCKCWCTSA